MAAIHSGVVPQQPPTMLSQPLRANSPSVAAVSVAVAEEAAEAVGHAGVRVATDVRLGDRRQGLDLAPHDVDADGAVEADAQGVEVRDRVVERLDRLPREGPQALLEDRPGDHHRDAAARVLEVLVDGEQARLHHERVERRLGQEDVDADSTRACTCS